MAKKHKFLSVCNLAVFAFTAILAHAAVADETHEIQVRYENGDFAKVDALITHDGMIIIQDQERDESPRSLRLQVDAKIKYDQRFTGSKKLLAIRAYDKATQAKISVSDGKQTTALTDKNRYIIARVKKEGPIQSASLEDVLSQSESELITNPADPLSFAKLFDKQDVKIGDKWDAPDGALSTFLSVDRVYENKVQLQLREVKGNLAKIYLLGRVKTEVDDVTNEITVSASAMIDLQSQKLVKLRASLQQKRDIGQIAPGFEGTTKVDLQMKEIDQLDSLSNHQISLRTQSNKIERKLKWQPENAQFALLYDPKWHMIASEAEGAVMRYLKNGTLLAQCNIVQLPSRAANSPLQLADFRKEVTKIIAKEKTARVADANQHATRSGIRALGVRVEGVEENVPVTWLYYHVSHLDGRQLTFVFTLEQDIAEQFRPADTQLLDSFVFLPVGEKDSGKNRSAENRSTSQRKR